MGRPFHAVLQPTTMDDQEDPWQQRKMRPKGWYVVELLLTIYCFFSIESVEI